MSLSLTRRELLRTAGTAGAAICLGGTLAGCSGGTPGNAAPSFRARPHPAAEEWKNRVGLAQGGDDPARNVRAAIEKLCGRDGAKTFIRPGDVVAVKPNIGWGESPEMAATVTPEVVAAAVRLCLEAGAAKVRVFDNTITAAALLRSLRHRGCRTPGRGRGRDARPGPVRHAEARRPARRPSPSGRSPRRPLPPTSSSTLRWPRSMRWPTSRCA